MSRDATWVFNPCTKFLLDTTYRYRVTIFGVKGSHISNFIFLTPKGNTLARTTHNDVLIVRVRPKVRPVTVAKRLKQGQKLSCVKLAICSDHPRRCNPMKFCMPGRVREIVIYFKVYENRLRGLGAVGVSKIALSHWLGPWLIQQLVLYGTSRDKCFSSSVHNGIRRPIHITSIYCVLSTMFS